MNNNKPPTPLPAATHALTGFDLPQRQAAHLLKMDIRTLERIGLPRYRVPQSNRIYYRRADIERLAQQSIENLTITNQQGASHE